MSCFIMFYTDIQYGMTELKLLEFSQMTNNQLKMLISYTLNFNRFSNNININRLCLGFTTLNSYLTGKNVYNNKKLLGNVYNKCFRIFSEFDG